MPGTEDERPLRSGDEHGPVRSTQDLAALLRQLRRREARRRGGRELTYRDLAAKTGWSHAIIGQYLTGSVLPPTDRFDALIRILGAAPGEQGALATARDQLEDRRRMGAADADTIPAEEGGPPQQAPAAPAAGSVPVHPIAVTPRQLPLAARHFTGRQAELAMLGDLADQAAAEVVVAVVDGTAGIGKSALAVHAAHRIAERFPDGQLYVNLRGFDPALPPIGAAEAVRGFLDAFAVPNGQLPATLEAQVGLYRSLLAGRRMLVLLDNARDVGQIRPLLPGSPGCMVIATSRNRLTGLVLEEHAQPLTLGLLPAAEAHELLTARLGAKRIRAERQAIAEIIDQCAGLPLALSIVAARATAQPGFPLAALAAGLPQRDAHAHGGGADQRDPSADIRAVFSWSYDCLSEPAARFFRLFGLHPGPDITRPAAAALAGLDAAAAREVLVELAGAHLLIEHAPGRFACHDLLKAYATELAHASETQTERSDAVHRVCDYYLHTAFAAALRIDVVREPIALAPPPPAVDPGTFTDHELALAWFENEHRVLLNSIELARQDERDAHAWQLAWSLAPYLDRLGHWHDWAFTHQTALEAARRLGDRAAEAYAHAGVGRAYDRLGRYKDAGRYLLRALRLYREVGDQLGEAETQLFVGGLYERQGLYRRALAHASASLELYRDSGKKTGLAIALNSVGWCHARLEDYAQALASCQQALALQQEAGDIRNVANTLDSVGYAYYKLGEFKMAIESYDESLRLLREVSDHYHEAVVLSHIGDVQSAAGDVGAARDAWIRALTILDPIDRADTDQVATRRDCPDAALVRARLRESGIPGPG